jgi:hypothetical protein
MVKNHNVGSYVPAQPDRYKLKKKERFSVHTDVGKLARWQVRRHRWNWTEGHPYVGLMVVQDDGNPFWRCSERCFPPRFS